MPIVFTHTPRLRLRTVTYFGVIDDLTLLRAYRAVVADYNADLDNLIDLSGITAVQLTAAGRRRLIELVAPIVAAGPPTRLAIIAPDARAVEVAGLLPQLHPHTGMQLCDTHVDALAWLGHVRAG